MLVGLWAYEKVVESDKNTVGCLAAKTVDARVAYLAVRKVDSMAALSGSEWANKNKFVYFKD